MFGFPIAEVAIGLCFVYLLLALICSTVNETIAGLTARRADQLEKGILCLLSGDTTAKDAIYNHPLVASLSDTVKKRKPSYIPSSRFAQALMDHLAGPESHPDRFLALLAGVKAAGAANKPYARSLNAVLADAAPNQSAVQQKIEGWFNDGMDRVSGWYKRKTMAWIIALSAVVTIAVNADTVRISRTLWDNQAIRTAVVEQAKGRVQAEQSAEPLPLVEYTDPDKPNEGKPVRPLPNAPLTTAERDVLGKLTGWSETLKEWDTLAGNNENHWQYFALILRTLIGLFLTIVAVSQGAPFWFDALNRFMNVRSSGRAPDEPRDKSSKPAGGSANAS